MGSEEHADSTMVKHESIFEDLGPDRRKRKAGEVFAFCVRPSRWFLGQITTTNGSIDVFKNVIVAIFFGREYSSEPTMVEFLKLTPNTKSLIPPQLMNTTGWRDGQFRTIGVGRILQPRDVTPHAFYDPLTKCFKNEFEEVVADPPPLRGFRGLGNVYLIGDEIEKSLRT